MDYFFYLSQILFLCSLLARVVHTFHLKEGPMPPLGFFKGGPMPPLGFFKGGPMPPLDFFKGGPILNEINKYISKILASIINMCIKYEYFPTQLKL